MKPPTYQSIVTRYHGATNTKGSRIKATAAAGSVVLSWDDSLNPDDNHARAAQHLADKFGWRGSWFGGGMPSSDGNVYVCVDEHAPAFVITGER